MTNGAWRALAGCVSRALGALLLACTLGTGDAAAQSADFESLARGFFPEADTVQPPAGEPPVRWVLAGGERLGLVFRTDEVTPIPAYSGRPVAVAVGLDMDGRIRGVRIVEHQEPILVVGISDEDLAAYVDQYRGVDAGQRVRVGGRAAPGERVVDGISGATITVMVINASIEAASRAVAHTHGLGAGARGAAAGRGAGSDAGAEAQADRPPLWHDAWANREGRLWLLGGGLVLLTTVLFLQDWLTRHPKLVTWLRTGFLVWTLVFVGWYALAQLSVVNVFTFVHAAMRDFSWDTFLIEPLVFVLWCYVAVTLLLWGRGVYCGWLCPYGALQELVNKAARVLRVPQLEIPALLHERLLAIKYVLLLGLFGLSLQSMSEAVRYAEVEPFKTAITLRFDRTWPYVAWALGLVAVSAVNGKFYCKYLCPLGAALTIPAHFRIFDWLRRRNECGNPCRTCYVECPSQAIRPTGEINANECHHCLDCQVTYWNPRKCPPLVERRKRAERAGRPLRLDP